MKHLPLTSNHCKTCWHANISIYFSFMYLQLVEFSRSRLGLLGFTENYRADPGLFHVFLILRGQTAIWSLVFYMGKAEAQDGKSRCTNTLQSFDLSTIFTIILSKQVTWPAQHQQGKKIPSASSGRNCTITWQRVWVRRGGMNWGEGHM